MSAHVFVNAPTYNKAPAPAQTPSQKLFPFKKEMKGGQAVWVSRPIPDKLHLTVRLKPDHFASWYKPDHPHDYGRMVMHALASGQAGAKLKNKYSEAAKLSTEVQIDLADIGEPLYVQLLRTKGNPEGLHTLNFQLNPTKLGEVGLFEFLDQLHEATGKRLLVGSMLADARVSRLDVAIDVVGVHVTEIVATVKDARVQAIWGAVEGDMETASFFRVKKSGGTQHGDLIATIYDKRAERIAAGFAPVYGLAPYSRIEVSKRRFGNKPFFLSGLFGMPNMLDVVRIGLATTAAPKHQARFQDYIAIRRTLGHVRATSLMKLSAVRAAAFQTAISTHLTDLIDGTAAWSFWPESIKETGLYLLLEAAAKKTGGVPSPDYADLAA